MFYELQFKAQADNIEKISIEKDQAVWFKLKCCRCNLETNDPVEIDPSAELTVIEGSPAGAQLVIRCKDCRTQGNISIEEQKNPLVYNCGSGKMQTILRLDCRNVEPISFHIKNDTFKVVACDSGVVYCPVDLSEGEWYDYDEKESREEFFVVYPVKVMEETDFLAPFDEKIPLSFDELIENVQIVEDTEQIKKIEHVEQIEKPLIKQEARYSTPIYQMLERIENKIKAEDHQKQFGFDDLVEKIQRTDKASKSSRATREKDDLWVDKYRPQKFTQLITMDSCNLEVLRWVKQWDFAKDLVLGKPKSEVLQRVDEHRKSHVKPVAGNGRNRSHPTTGPSDQLERPERKILLIHGQPGLGKTTLAHVIAQTTGYSVLEINASDERMGNSVITKISSALEVKSSFTSDRKPSMIVIDEIDGAAAAGNENNLIKYLVKLATMKTANKKNVKQTKQADDAIDSDSDYEATIDTNTNPNNNTKVKGKKGSSGGLEGHGLLHPIICICNDLYVPALRPLRQVAQILQVKPIGPVQLSLRLKSICDAEGLKINARTLVDLAEVMDSDVRSALNALQFLHKKTLSGSATNFNRDLTFGAFKDTVKPPMKIYDAIFHSSAANNNNNNLKRSNTSSKYSELLEMIWGSGLEMEKLMTGCFEIYPNIKFFDNTTMDRINAGLEVFSSFDLISTSSPCNGRLDGYLAYKLCKLKELFSTPVYSSIKYPKEDYENYLINSEFKAIFKDYTMNLSSKTRSESGSRDALLLERIPAILYSSLSQFSNIKSSNPQLMRPEDKQKLMKSVEILSNENLFLRQIKIPESSTYKFVLDSPIDRLSFDHLITTTTIMTSSSEATFSKIYDNETPQDSHTYSLCRLIAAEMENLRIRKQKSKISNSPITTGTATVAENNTKKRTAIDISQVTLPKDVKKRVACDFFGRPIVISDEATALKESTLNNTKMTIWYVQNDGVSNAVRRNIKINSFLN